MGVKLAPKVKSEDPAPISDTLRVTGGVLSVVVVVVVQSVKKGTNCATDT